MNTEHDSQSKKDEAAEQAGHLKDQASHSAKEVAHTAADEAKSVARDAQSEIRSLVNSGLDEVNAQAGTGQQKLAVHLHGLVDELDAMARNSEQPGIATDVVRQVADRGRSLAGWLQHHEPQDALDEIRRYAARKPVAFLALAAGAGLIVGRFVRGVRDEGSDDRRQPQRAVGTDYAPPTETLTTATTGAGHGGAGYGGTAPADASSGQTTGLGQQTPGGPAGRPADLGDRTATEQSVDTGGLGEPMGTTPADYPAAPFNRGGER